MKILHTFYDRPAYAGGPTIHARRCLPLWRERGHRVEALCIFQEGAAPTADLLQADGIPVHRISLEDLRYGADTMAYWVLDRVREIQPDVFVSNISVGAAYAGRWIRRSGIPVVATHRSDDALNWAMAERFGAAGSPWSVSGMVCIHSGLVDDMRRRFGRTVPLTATSDGAPIPDVPTDHHAPRLRLLYAGRFNQAQKRVHAVFRIFEDVLKARPDLEATLLGSGEEQAALEAGIAASPVGKRLHLLPPQSGEAYLDALCRHHILLLPSAYEGTPGTLLDAMGAGLVPVCTPEANASGLVQDQINGRVCAFDESRMVSSILDLVERTDVRLQAASEGRSRILATHSLEASADHWLDFLAKLHAERRKRRKIPNPSRLNLPDAREAFQGEDLSVLPRPVRKWPWQRPG